MTSDPFREGDERDTPAGARNATSPRAEGRGAWRVASVLEDDRMILEGAGIRIIGAKYAEPWPVYVLEDIRSLVAESGARSCTVVGAHIGEPIVALAGMCDEMYAYEPGPANCYLIAENLELSGARAKVRCEAASSSDGTSILELDGSYAKVELVGINRVINGRTDLVLLLCRGCAAAASGLGCAALSLPKGYVFPRKSELGGRLKSCGFSLKEARAESLALGPRARFKRRFGGLPWTWILSRGSTSSSPRGWIASAWSA